MADDRFTGVFHVRGNYVSRSNQQNGQPSPYEIERNRITAEFVGSVPADQTELKAGPIDFTEYEAAEAAAGAGYVDAVDLYQELNSSQGSQSTADALKGLVWDVETVGIPMVDANGAIVRKNGQIVWANQSLVQVALAEHDLGTNGSFINNTANRTANLYFGEKRAMDYYQKLLGLGPNNTWSGLGADRATLREFSPYLRTLWNAGAMKLADNHQDIARFNFNNLTETKNGVLGLTDEAKMVFSNAFELLKSNGTLETPDKVANQLLGHLQGFAGAKYGSFIQIGANIKRFDIPLMNSYLAQATNPTSMEEVFGNRVFDTYAVQRSLRDPNQVFRIHERNLRASYKKTGPVKYRLTGLNIDSFRNINEAYGRKSIGHDALFDIAEEAMVANASFEGLGKDLARRGSGAYGKNVKTHLLYAKRGIYGGSDIDGSYYRDADGQWRLNHQGARAIGAGGAYKPVLIGGQEIHQFNRNGNTYYGRMFEDYDTGMRHFVSSTNKSDMERLLSTSFQSAPIGKDNPLFANRVRRLEDYARRQYEGMFIGNKPGKTWDTFTDTMSTLRAIKSDQSLWDELANFNPLKQIEDSGYMIERLQGSSAMRGKSMAQIRNMVWMFPRLSKEFEGLTALESFVGGMTGDAYERGQILGLSYDTLRTQQSAARRSKLTVNEFDLSKSVLLYDAHGGARGSMNLVASDADSIYSALYSAYKGAEPRAAAQRKAVFDVVHNLYDRAEAPGLDLSNARKKALRLLNSYMTDDGLLPSTAIRSVASSVSGTIGYIQKKSNVFRNEVTNALVNGTYKRGLAQLPVVGAIDSMSTPFSFHGVDVEGIVSQASSDYRKMRGFEYVPSHKDAPIVFSDEVNKLLAQNDKMIDRRMSRFVNKSLGNPMQNATREALQSITQDFIQNGFEVQYIIDNRNNKIVMVGMANEIANQMMRQYRNDVGAMAADKRAVTVDIPLLDSYGNFYYQSGYKTNPLILRRKKDISTEAAQSHLQGMIRRIDAGENISGTFATTFELTDAYTNVINATKNSVHKTMGGTYKYQGSTATRTARIMRSISKGTYHEVAGLMTQDWISNVKDVQPRSIGYRVTNSAEFDINEIALSLSGLTKRRQLGPETQRAGLNAAYKLFTHGNLLTDGSRFSTSGKLEAVGGLTVSLQGREDFSFLGEFASPGREEAAQAFNNRVFNRADVIAAYGNDPRRMVPLTAKRKQLSQIIRRGEGNGIIDSINAGVLVADDEMMRAAAKELGINLDTLPTITENSGIISSRLAEATRTTEHMSIKYGLGDKMTGNLMRDLQKGNTREIRPGTVVGYSNGQPIVWTKPRTFKAQGIEQSKDGSFRIVGEVLDTAERSSQKLVRNDQKMTTNINDQIIDFFREQTGRDIDAIVGGKAKKQVGYVYLTDLVNSMFQEITENMAAKNIVLDKKVQEAILNSLNTAFSDTFTTDKAPIDWLAAIRGGSADGVRSAQYVLEGRSLRPHMGRIQLGGSAKVYNNFYAKAQSLLSDAGYGDLLSGNLPSGQYAGRDYMVGVSAITKAAVDDWPYSVSATIGPGQKGVVFGIREMEALQSHSIVVGGKEYGYAREAEKYYAGLINPVMAKEFGLPSTRSQKEWANTISRAQDKFVAADVLSGKYDPNADLKRRYGRNLSIDTVNLTDYNQAIDTTDSEAFLRHSIFDTEGDGRIVKLDQSYNIGGREINQFFLPGKNAIGSMPKEIDANGNVAMPHDPYRSAAINIVNAQAEASAAILDLEKTATGAEYQAGLKEIVDHKTASIERALGDIVLRTSADTAEATGFIARNVLGTQQAHSGHFRLAGRNIFSADQSVEISTKRLESMLAGRNQEFIDAFMEVASSEEGFAGAARMGRNPKFFGTSEGFVTIKASNNLADMQVRTSLGRAEMLQGDFDSDTATLALFNVEGLEQEFLTRKRAGEDPKTILREFARRNSEWVTQANKDPNGSWDLHAGNVSQTEAMFREAALFARADETTAGTLQDLVRKSNQSAFGKADDIIDAVGREQISLASKAYKNIGAASNASTRLRRSFAAMGGAIGTLGVDEMEQAFGAIGRAGTTLDALNGLQNIIQYAADFNTQGSTSGFGKRLVELVKAGNGADISQQVSDLVSTLSDTGRALNTADFEKITGTLHKLGIENVADLKDAYALGLGSTYGGATENPIARAISEALQSPAGPDGTHSIDTAIADIFRDRESARGVLSNILPMFKNNDAFNAFLVKPSQSENFTQALDMMDAILHPDGTSVMSPWAGKMFKALNMQEGLEAFEEAQQTMGKMMSNLAISYENGSAGYKSYRRWDTAEDDARDAAVRMAGHAKGGFAVGGFAAGAIGAGAVWALSAATRPAPDVQLGVADQAPSSDGRYVDPSLLPPAPGGAGIPTARIMMDNDAMSQIRMSISGNLRGRNKVQAEDLLYSVQAQMNSMGISANVTLNNNDKSTRTSRREAEEKFKHYAENGYAY